MERFLYRLSKSPYANNFVLKGALMFNVWRGPLSRPTMDIDLLGRLSNDIESIIAALKIVCTQEVEPDGLVFDPDSVSGERIIEGVSYEGIRVRLRGTLGTARVVIQVDIAFGDIIVPFATTTDYPTILDLPVPSVQGYSKESTIAEKLQIMVRLGVLNSRLKDFYDIWLLSREFHFEGRTLASAIKETFRARETEIPAQPDALMAAFAQDADKQSQWRGFRRRTLLEDPPEDLLDLVDRISTFLAPVMEAIVLNKPFSGVWEHPGPWKEMEKDEA
ncbi:MAG: nucleotidyl transferase AbiEii/AbiGii toxin family protein [Desulfomonile sp.]|nr:nucleotidyl transferase AbiEii/AbiGii toxin family protein [Desulfomonile sp.]